jgi:Mg-chelatase subunit ChlD
MSSEVPQLSVTDRLLASTESRPRLTAKLHNEGVSVVREVSVVAVISDKTGTPVGGSATFVEAVAPGESAPLTFTWSEPFNYNADTEACTQPVDVILAIDRSGSMSSDSKIPPQPLTQAKEAAADFVSLMSEKDQVGYVSFATEATNPIDQELSGNRDRVRERILMTQIGSNGIQYTNIGDALVRARSELRSQRRNPEANPVIILLTDGAPTYPKDPSDPNFPEKYARQAAEALKQDGVSIFTIGLGEELNEPLLIDIASTPAQYYRAATGADLAKVYRSVAVAVCKKAPPVVEIFPRVNNVP